MKELIFTVKSGFFNRSRTLILNEKFISFGSINIKKKDIIAFRYGIRWIRLDLTFGREYVIFIKDKKNREVKINFKSFFGRKINKNHMLYADLVDHLWDYYLQDVIRGYLKKYDDGEPFNIGKIYFSTEGITIKRSIFKDLFIPWDKVRTNNYQTYFAIHSADAPAEINVGLSYLADWNTSVLYSVLRGILQAKQIEVYE